MKHGYCYSKRMENFKDFNKFQYTKAFKNRKKIYFLTLRLQKHPNLQNLDISKIEGGLAIKLQI